MLYPSGGLAQLGERGLCKPEVEGSIPLPSTSRLKDFLDLLQSNSLNEVRNAP